MLKGLLLLALLRRACHGIYKSQLLPTAQKQHQALTLSFKASCTAAIVNVYAPNAAGVLLLYSYVRGGALMSHFRAPLSIYS